MQFNSVVFLKFFAAFLLLYHLVRGHRGARNWLVVVGSYTFYGWWDYRFLALLLASSLLDYAVGLRLEATSAAPARRRWVMVSLAGNLGILGAFKYCGFFVDSLAELLTALGFRADLPTLRLVLPVGISFYTFQTLSYTLDVYRRQIVATRDLGAFLAYVSFFPQLVAGPIERASALLPQFLQPRVITRSHLEEGVWLVLWGLFKKVVVADNLAPLVEMAFDQPAPSGPLVVLGTVAFGFQIYADFSGYSDLARGLARVLGFELRWNFRLPYGAGNVREFWRRWHISLSTWLRDYLYISLGGNRRGPARTRVNLLLTMVLGGLWHGAAWHFVVWGLWHGLGLLGHRIWESARPGRTALAVPEDHGAGWKPAPQSLHQTAAQAMHQAAPQAAYRTSWVAWLLTISFVFYGWLLFRAPSLARAWVMTKALGDWSSPVWLRSYGVSLVAFTAPLVAMQVWQARRGDLLVALTLPGWARALLQGALLVGVLLFWEKGATPFIYFQF